MVLVSIRTPTKCLFRKIVQKCVCVFESILKMELRNGSRFYKNAYKVFVSKIVQR